MRHVAEIHAHTERDLEVGGKQSVLLVRGLELRTGVLASQHFVQRRMPVRGGDDPIAPQSLPAGQLDAHGGAVLHQYALDSRAIARSEEHTSELQSLRHLVCRLLLEK